MKLRRGWFKRARAKWVRTRLYSFDWYSGKSVEICAWAEWRNGDFTRCSRGFCIGDTQRQALDVVMDGDFWTARRMCRVVSGAHMYFHKRENFASNGKLTDRVCDDQRRSGMSIARCPRCDCWYERYTAEQNCCYACRSSDSEQIPKPAAREAAGVRVQRIDGLDASGASGSCAGLRPDGAGHAPEAAAQDKPSAGQNSQLADGLPRCGSSESEPDLLACSHALLVAVVEFLNDWMKRDFDLPPLARCDAEAMEQPAMHLRAALQRAKRSASVKPIASHEAERRSVADE